jgi:hypothetical protein
MNSSGIRFFGGRDADDWWNRPMGKQPIQAKARDAALNQGIPNFFFHLQTAYAILRAKGVPIGKRDYIGNFLAP